MIVVDASVLIHILLDAAVEPQIIDRLESANGLLAPYFIDLEVINGIRKQLFLKKIRPQQADAAIDDFQSFTIDRRSTHEFNSRIWELRSNLTPYDAAYVTLAEMVDLPLITRDGKIAKVKGLRTPIILV
jgi:predicted nucleic acid-binding protein